MSSRLPVELATALARRQGLGVAVEWHCAGPLRATKEHGDGPVDHVETLPSDGGAATADSASTVAVRCPGETRSSGKRLADLGHGPTRHTALAGCLLKDVRRKAAADADPHSRNPKLSAQAVQLVLLDLAAMQGGAASTTESTLVVAPARRAPVGVHPVSTLVTHVLKSSSPAEGWQRSSQAS